MALKGNFGHNGAHKQTVAIRVCPECTKQFNAHHLQQKYCGNDCSQATSKRARKEAHDLIRESVHYLRLHPEPHYACSVKIKSRIDATTMIVVTRGHSYKTTCTRDPAKVTCEKCHEAMYEEAIASKADVPADI